MQSQTTVDVWLISYMGTSRQVNHDIEHFFFKFEKISCEGISTFSRHGKKMLNVSIHLRIR